MSFSLRTAFAAFTVLAVLVAAFFSGNWVFVSVCSLAVFVLMLASLPLALLTESTRKRLFFVTFSIVSIGIFLASGYFSAVDALAAKVVSMREVQAPLPAYPRNGQSLIPAGTNLIVPRAFSEGSPRLPVSQPAPFSDGPTVLTPRNAGTGSNLRPMVTAPLYISNIYEVRELKKLVTLLIACIVGAVVGCAISRLTPSGSQSVVNVNPSARKAG